MGHRLVSVYSPCEFKYPTKTRNKRDFGREMFRFPHFPALVSRIGFNPTARRALRISHMTWDIGSLAFIHRASLNTQTKLGTNAISAGKCFVFHTFPLLYLELASTPLLTALSVYHILHGTSTRQRLSAVRV